MSFLSPLIVLLSEKPSFQEQLAARELCRYLYLRTGTLPRIQQGPPGDAPTIHLKVSPALAQTLGPDGYTLKTTTPKTLEIIGASETAVLYGAYALLEHYGIRFYLHGDVIPDAKIPLELPALDVSAKPLFALRGIQPFHDFPEGPDWWDAGDYEAVISQLPKLGMNFFGLHTYPEGSVGPEPTVWIGPKEEIGEGGQVKAGYPASYAHSLRGFWGYAPKKTSDYLFGSGMLFQRDDYGPEVLQGNPEGVFERAATLLDGAFRHARRLGVKTCVGTETPLTVPKLLRERLKAAGKDADDPAVVKTLYEGMFRRIAQAYPLDYYWLWTSEGWTWEVPKDEEVAKVERDLALAGEAIRGMPFTLATCGWVLGPPKDRGAFDRTLPKSVPFSCINRYIGVDPVEPAFAQVQGRPKWAIPWMEDDPGMIIPQLWVSRMRRDAAEALDYGCTGLMGIHWRTEVLSMNVTALARAAWTQEPWRARRKPLPDAALGGLPTVGASDDVLCRTVRNNVRGYDIALPDGNYTITLRFFEPTHDKPGRRVFGVEVQGRRVVERLDIVEKVGKGRVLDIALPDIVVKDGRLEIRFVAILGSPCVATIAVQGTDGKKISRKIDCVEVPDASLAVPSDDFYLDWACAQFGPEAGPEAAALFASLDGRLPRPATWVDGPGGITPDPRPWDQVATEYAFVDHLAALRDRVKGAGSLERFDYWLAQFRYLRTLGCLNCALASGTEVAARLKEVYGQLLLTVNTPGEMGTLANWNQHVLPLILGKGLSAEIPLGKDYNGPVRVIVPTRRGSVGPKERVALKIIVLSSKPPGAVFCRWRALGGSDWKVIPAEPVARGVYKAVLPEPGDVIGVEYETWADEVRGPSGSMVVTP